MIGVLTGGGLAAAAGLNAAIPLLLLGLGGRLVGDVVLPAPWMWLTDERVLACLALLLVLELLSDAVPVLEQVNDWAQTVLRPASGGIAFAAGVGAQHVGTGTSTVAPTWLLVLAGVGIALAVHIGRLVAGEIARTADGAGAGGALTAAGNGGAIALTASALAAPAAVIAVGTAIVVGAVLWAASRIRATAIRRPDGIVGPESVAAVSA